MPTDVEQRSQDARLINSLAAVQMSFSQYDRALKLLTLSDWLDSGHERTLVLLAHVFFRLREFQTVLSVLEQIEYTRNKPLGKHEHQLKSRTLALMGRIDEAKSVPSEVQLPAVVDSLSFGT